MEEQSTYDFLGRHCYGVQARPQEAPDMRRERIHLQGDITVETGKDTNGRFFIAHALGVSVYLRDPQEVREFLDLPPKTPSVGSLDSWFASLSLADQQKHQPAKETGSGLLEEALQTGFGPECHLDQSDPNFQTRTII
jgi:hypothetical protein